MISVALLIAALGFAWRAVRLQNRAEAFRIGCLLNDGMPPWGAPVGHSFTDEGQALRRRARRMWGLTAVGAVAALLLLGR